MPTYILADNGSTQPAATKQLRKLAQDLGEQTGKTVNAVSLMHANRIDPQQIDGKPAEIFYDFMREKLQQGERDFVLLPLFFGESKAITSFIPDKQKMLVEEFGEFGLTIADVIYPMPQGEARLTDIISDHIQLSIKSVDTERSVAALVDHGSPIAKVTAVRQHLAQTVIEKIGDRVDLKQAVMERREGKEYDFNGQLLKDWLTDMAEQGVAQVAVIMMFFLPGRHAGEGGDVVEICQSVMDQYENFNVTISPLIGDHPLLVCILADRLTKVA